MPKAVVNRSSNRRDTPLEEAVALMVRERLTGQAPPARRQAVCRSLAPLDRGKGGNRASAILARPSTTRRHLPGLSRDIIAALDMADELGDDPDQSDENDNQDETEPDAGERQETPDGEEQESQQSAAEEMQDSEGETDAAEMEAQQMDIDEQPDDLEGEEQNDGEEPWRPAASLLVALQR